MDIFAKLQELSFPVGHYAVVGSGLLAALGLREANDLDLVVDVKLRRNIERSGQFTQEIRWNKTFFVADGIDIITCITWEDYPTTVDEVITGALIVNGFPFMNPDELVKFKRALGRDKDFHDIELLEKWRCEQSR